MKAVRRSRTSLFNDVLGNFLFKEIFKGCCLLFSYQCSCRSLSSDSFDILSNLISFVKNFFNLFCFSLSLTSQLRYITIFTKCLSTLFYNFFKFSSRYYIWWFLHDIIHNLTFEIQKLPEISSSFLR